ncbi:competence protein ComEC [Roseibium aquae]|uniref:Competence protein ComEC n=1 Tax=Roseibium aquae TaxID=1323746 RepID=A0A916TMD9_9HYPH|nr:ComEC/Rec2 family competence protein [Roseibium aquae]GGB60285.1 competence protein ComEC [Roseibium aquae]
MDVDALAVIVPGQSSGGHPPWRRWIAAALPEPVHPSTGSSQTRRRLDRLLELHRLLLVALGFSAGIWGYFSLPEEPNLIIVLSLFSISLVAALNRWHGGRLGLGTLLVVAALGGAASGTLRTALVDAPRLTEEATVTVTGRVSAVGWTDRGQRIVLEVTAMQAPAYAVRNGIPNRVRLSLPKDTRSAVGEGLRVRARLFPPSGPVRPGGYDFAFSAYFQGLGATGFAYGAPEPVELSSSGWTGEVWTGLQAVRGGIAQRILGLSEDPDTAGVAIALLVGNRDRITQEAEDSLREAGLAHILAISGLHMALFAGGAYSVFLFALALSQTAALTWPIHRIAAVAALIAATGYLALSGASVATQRSYLMIALVFLGILVGRRGLTLRSVALAALALLILGPERLFHPGFQMSFAAVFCLVAAYDQLRQWQPGYLRRFHTSGFLGRATRTTCVWTGGLFITAVVAGLATGIVGAHHFGRIAPYGLVGNMLGMPVFSLLVMPMGVLTLLAVPFGLAAYPLALMEAGLWLVLEISRFTAGLDAGEGYLVPPGTWATLGLFAGLGVLLLLPGRFKLAAMLPLLVAAGALGTARPPDIQVSDRGMAVAARDAAGVLRLSQRRSGFASDMWLQAEGLAPSAFSSRKMTQDQRRCDPSGCVVRAYPRPAAGGRPDLQARPFLIAFPRTAAALAHDCRRADMIVTDLTVGDWCSASIVLDAAGRARSGSVSIWLQIAENADGTEMPSVRSLRRAKSDPPRPWHR